MKRKTAAMLMAFIAMLGFGVASASSASAFGTYGTTENGTGTYYNTHWNQCNGYWSMGWGVAPGGSNWCGYGGKVHVVDHTPADWPVHDAVNVINSYLAVNDADFRMVYHWQSETTCGTLGRDSCLDVYATLGGTADFGRTYTTGGVCSLKAGTGIALNDGLADSFPLSTTQRRGVVMHELYHGIGMAHSTNATDLMYYAGTGPDGNPSVSINRATPSVGDSSTIIKMYGKLNKPGASGHC